MNYRSIEDLNAAIVAGLHRLPPGADLVVAIPGSGLLAANLLALHLNVPLADVDGFLHGRLLGAGKRLDGGSREIHRFRNIVVIDDTAHTGSTLRSAKDRLLEKSGDAVLHCGAVFADPGADHLDFCFETCELPAVCEWRLMHDPLMERACVDIDGVLCRDPLKEENDDGERYLRFLQNAEKLLPCTGKIGCLVTNRLEKYRPQTEAWLASAGIRYRELVMRDCASQEERRAQGDYGGYKGRVYASRADSPIFIESCVKQAHEIARVSGKIVYCVDARRLVRPGDVLSTVRVKPGGWSGVVRRTRRMPGAIKRLLKRAA